MEYSSLIFKSKDPKVSYLQAFIIKIDRGKLLTKKRISEIENEKFNNLDDKLNYDPPNIITNCPMNCDFEGEEDIKHVLECPKLQIDTRDDLQRNKKNEDQQELNTSYEINEPSQWYQFDTGDPESMNNIKNSELHPLNEISSSILNEQN